ncbi:MAG: tetratricopeptide repeat protein [Spirochaetales bacterium]|nr:tetratricopeptide repeat protein [Spirochaetales bacterium]
MKKLSFFTIILLISLLIFLSMQNIDQSVEEKIPPIWELYYKGELNQALGLAISLLSKSPEHPEINLIIGRIYVDLKQYVVAIPYLEKAIKNDPNFTKIKSWALAYQGVAFYMTNQPIEAKRVLQFCVDLNIEKDSVAFARKRISIYGLSVFFEDWKNTFSNDFSIFMQPAVGLDVKSFLQNAEESLKLVKTIVPYESRKRINIFLWQSWETGPIIIGENIPYENYVYLVSHLNYKDSIARSIAKIVVYNRYFPLDPIVSPIIFEGFGYYIEKYNSDLYKEAKEVIKNQNILSFTIKKLWLDWNAMPSQVKPSISAAFVKYLIEVGGIQKFNELLKDMSYGNAEKIYGSSLEKIISDFDKKVLQ